MKEANILKALAEHDHELAAQVHEVLQKKLEKVVHEGIMETMANFRDALENEEIKKIQKAIKKIREALRIEVPLSTDVDKKATETTAGIPTQNYILAFEKATGKSLENVQCENKIRISFNLDGQVIERSPDALFRSVARILIGKANPYKGRILCTFIRDGKTPEEAAKLLKVAEATGELSQQYLIAFEKAAKKPLKDLETRDTAPVTFQVGSVTVQRSPNALFGTVARKILGKGTSYKGRILCTYIRDGKTPAEAKKLLEEAEAAGEINQGYLAAFEKGAGRTLEEMVSTDTVPIAFKVGSVALRRSPNALFSKIAYNVTGEGNYSRSRLYCIFIRDGKTPAEAKKLVEDAEAASEVNQEYLLAFEKGAGKTLENMEVKDVKSVYFIVRSIKQERSPRALFLSISTAALGYGSENKGRSLCILIRNGKNLNEAKKLVNLGKESEEDDEFEKLDSLNIDDAIALLGNDPAKLKLYLQYSYKHLSENEIDKLVIRSFKGLNSKALKKEEQYLKWDIELPSITLNTEIPETTDQNTITVSGSAPDAECVYVAGTWNRRVSVKEDGTFSVKIPLQIGEYNEIRIMSLDREQKLRSEQDSFFVVQIGKADDIEALFRLLSQMRNDLQKEITTDPGRLEFFTHCAERMLIKKFSLSFAEGESYIEDLIRKTESKIIQKVLRNVLKRFRSIEKAKFPNVQENTLRFFQKYTAYEIRRRMSEGRKGINIANDPGTGKTRTILAAIADQEAAIFTPNAVVSTWDQEAGRVLIDPDLLVLRNAPHERRKELLRTAEHLRLVTNVQFLQNPDDAERFQLLSNIDTIVVHDEAHSRANEGSQQSKGAKKLRHKFQINVTATLAKDPNALRRILATLEPDNPKFKSDDAFAKAFPAKDPGALKALKLLVDKYTIRFRKEDVMEEVDPDTLLSTQLHRLPKRIEVQPEEMGNFEMSDDQAQALYEMFLNWAEWTKKYDHYMPKDELSEEDHLRVSGALVKKHALRQSINNPAYINSNAKDAKLQEVEKIIKACQKEGRKVVIFCAYAAQTKKYAAHFAHLNPALYTGITSKEGEKKDASGMPQKFLRKKAAHGFSRDWELDAKGYPKTHPKGEVMQALDYELMTFQNAPDRQLAICTYNAGSVGTTFTAGKAMILDDLPRDVIEDIQAKDRIHRIDPHHMTHSTVQYYSMISRYPESFLNRMKKRWVVRQPNGTYEEYRSLTIAQKDQHVSEKNPVKSAYDMFFAQGTYDQVHSDNLKVQRHMFRLINDGIGDESILNEDQLKFAGLENGNGH